MSTHRIDLDALLRSQREDPTRLGRFRNPMDAASVRQRVVLATNNPIYALAVQAAGHQSAFTVDKLAWKLNAALPGLIADLAAEVERGTPSVKPADKPDRRMSTHTPEIPAALEVFPSPTRWRRARWDEPGTIYFYSGTRGPHRRFSNFDDGSPFPMPAWYDPTVILLFDSGEHGFQCAKGRNKTEHERIRHAGSPYAAKQAAWRYPCPADWNRRRSRIMLTVVRAKFSVPELRELLLCTGDRILAEDSPRDFVWGCRDRNGGYTGQNLLGRALMRVRDEARYAAEGDARSQTGR